MKSIEELKREHKDQLTKLKAQQKAEFERVRALERKKEALERAAERKAENHVKYLLAGDIIADMKQSKDVSRLNTLAEKLTNDKDKAAVERLIASILAVSIHAPDGETSVPDETAPEVSDKKRGGLFKRKPNK